MTDCAVSLSTIELHYVHQLSPATYCFYIHRLHQNRLWWQQVAIFCEEAQKRKGSRLVGEDSGALRYFPLELAESKTNQ